MATFSKSQVVEQGSFENFAKWAECYKIYLLPNRYNFIAIRSERDEQAMFGSQSCQGATLVWERGRAIPFDWDSLISPSDEVSTKNTESDASNTIKQCIYCQQSNNDGYETHVISGLSNSLESPYVNGHTVKEEASLDFIARVHSFQVNDLYICRNCLNTEADSQSFESKKAGIIFFVIFNAMALLLVGLGGPPSQTSTYVICWAPAAIFICMAFYTAYDGLFRNRIRGNANTDEIEKLIFSSGKLYRDSLNVIITKVLPRLRGEAVVYWPNERFLIFLRQVTNPFDFYLPGNSDEILRQVKAVVEDLNKKSHRAEYH